MQTVAEPRGYFGSWETGSQAAVILESRAKKQQHHREEKMREVLIFNATYLILDMSGDMLQEAKATVEFYLEQQERGAFKIDVFDILDVMSLGTLWNVIYSLRKMLKLPLLCRPPDEIARHPDYTATRL